MCSRSLLSKSSTAKGNPPFHSRCGRSSVAPPGAAHNGAGMRLAVVHASETRQARNPSPHPGDAHTPGDGGRPPAKAAGIRPCPWENGLRQLARMRRGPPPHRDGLVPRPRLVRRLLAAPNVPLALLVAPAGYGKTTLLAQWDR